MIEGYLFPSPHLALAALIYDLEDAQKREQYQKILKKGKYKYENQERHQGGSGAWRRRRRRPSSYIKVLKGAYSPEPKQKPGG